MIPALRLRSLGFDTMEDRRLLNQRLLRSARCNFFDRPLGVFTDHWFFIVERVLQNGEGVHVADISQHDGDITQVAAAFGALNGSPLEA